MITENNPASKIMGIAGGALLPPLYGEVSKMPGSKQPGYWLMIPCYLFILYDATKGYRAIRK